MLRTLKKDISLSILSGLLLILSFPVFNLWICAWFGFVPVFFALNNKSKKEAFLLFFITGLIFWSGVIYWLIHVTLAGVIILIIYLALYFGVFGLIIRPFTKRSTLSTLIFIPSAWVLLEYIRSFLLTGFPWAVLGYSQFKNLPVIQIADITGAWGVSFLLIFVNTAIVEIIWLKKQNLLARLKKVMILAGLFLVLVLSYGFLSLSWHTQAVSKQKLKIAVIQGNIPQELKWDPQAMSFILNKYVKLTEKASKSNPDLIVWPEASSPGLLGEDDWVFDNIYLLAKSIKSPLLIGTVRKDQGAYFNSSIIIDNNGLIVGQYDKLHLVPFGEYIPLKKYLPFLETVVPIGDINAGKEYALFKIPNQNLKSQNKFAVLICFEDLFPELSCEFVRRKAEFLVNITNDAWYKKSSAPYQHLQASVFRAIENRVPLVRSANTGISAFISSTGNIFSVVRDKNNKDIFVDGFAIEEISIKDKKLSFYTRFPRAFIGICLLIFLLGLIFKPRHLKSFNK